jgi:hypothetical protein
VLGGERIVQGDIMRITLPRSLRTEHNTRHTMLLTNEIVQLNSGVFLNGHLVSLVCSPDKPSSSTTTDTPLLPPAPSGLKWKLHRKVSIPLWYVAGRFHPPKGSGEWDRVLKSHGHLARGRLRAHDPAAAAAPTQQEAEQRDRRGARRGNRSACVLEDGRESLCAACRTATQN